MKMYHIMLLRISWNTARGLHSFVCSFIASYSQHLSLCIYKEKDIDKSAKTVKRCCATDGVAVQADIFYRLLKNKD